MKTPGQCPAASHGKQAASADATGAGPDPLAIGPAIGPLPPSYVPPSGQPGLASPLWHAAARAARRAGGWVTRHLLEARFG